MVVDPSIRSLGTRLTFPTMMGTFLVDREKTVSNSSRSLLHYSGVVNFRSLLLFFLKTVSSSYQNFRKSLVFTLVGDRLFSVSRTRFLTPLTGPTVITLPLPKFFTVVDGGDRRPRYPFTDYASTLRLLFLGYESSYYGILKVHKLHLLSTGFSYRVMDRPLGCNVLVTFYKVVDHHR